MIGGDDELLVLVLHQLREPVTTIALWEQVLRENPADDAVHRRGLDAIRRSTQEQTQLMKHLLDLSRAMRGTLRIERRPIHAQPVLRHVVEGKAPVAAAAGVSLVVEGRHRIGRVLGDPVRLRQVLEFVIGTAVAETASAGQVVVTTRRMRGAIEIAVRDWGPGMTQGQLAQLRDRARLAEVILETRGRGLERLLCQYLAELLGGDLTGTSAGPGLGSTWTLTLPALRTATAAEID